MFNKLLSKVLVFFFKCSFSQNTYVPLLNIFADSCIMGFDFCQFGRCAVVSHCGFNLDFPDEQWCWTLFSVKATTSMACSWPKISPFLKNRYQVVENVTVVFLCTIEKLVTCLSHNIPISAFYIVSTFLKFVWIKQNVGNVQVDRILLYHLPLCWKTIFSAYVHMFT